MIILDTNVFSEATRLAPSDAVLNWMKAYDEHLFLTSISQAELLYGLELLPAGKRKIKLQAQLESLFEEVEGQILPFDEAAAREFGRLATGRRKIGRPYGLFDCQIAAIARARDASLATRNIHDFEGYGLKLINPWDAGKTYSN
jgi:predicted nucleic acid-binding protein